MSRLRQTKIATPSNPPANTEELYYATAGPGYNTPPALMSVDESGNLAAITHYAVLTYRFLKVTENKVAGAGTWTPANGCRLAFVECVGAGGSGGGGATSSTQVSAGSGGGGGGYAAKTLTGASIKSTSYSVGTKGAAQAAGANGVVGGNTTWDTNVIIAVGGGLGVAQTAGTTSIHQLGGAGGTGSTGDIVRDGGVGGSGVRFNTVLGFGGAGGVAPGGVCGASEVSSPAGGTAGVTCATTAWGGGGGGGCTSTTASAGGAGADGMVRIWEYA